MGTPNTPTTILKVGAALGVVDGISAVVINRALSPTPSAVRTFQGVAYALLGKDAFAGGVASMSLGIAMHFAVAFTWTSIFTLAYRQTPLHRVARGPVRLGAVGVVFGALIWLTMTMVVFPLTRIGGHAPVTSRGFIVNLVHHMLVVGPLVAVLVARSVRQPHHL